MLTLNGRRSIKPQVLSIANSVSDMCQVYWNRYKNNFQQVIVVLCVRFFLLLFFRLLFRLIQMQINYWPVLSLFSFVDPFNLCSLLFALFAFCVLITFSLCMVCKKREQRERKIVLLFLLFDGGRKKTKKKQFQFQFSADRYVFYLGVFPIQILRYNKFICTVLFIFNSHSSWERVIRER